VRSQSRAENPMKSHSNIFANIGDTD